MAVIENINVSGTVLIDGEQFSAACNEFKPVLVSFPTNSCMFLCRVQVNRQLEKRNRSLGSLSQRGFHMLICFRGDARGFVL